MIINGVFEGGGIKGIAYIGVLRFLEERGIRFFQVGGTSVGSIFASLITAGYNSYEIEELLNHFDINILTPKNGEKKLSFIINTIKNKGLYSISELENYIYRILKDKGKVYFRDLKFGDKYLLRVVSTELKTKRMVIIPDELKQFNFSTDRFLISRAVAMSANIPLFYYPYNIGKYTFVDGGVTNNFPLDLFADSSIPTLCFSISTAVEPKIIKKYKKKIFKVDDEYDFDKFNIIEINNFNIKATDFEKGMAYKSELIRSGYNSMRKFFYDNITK